MANITRYRTAKGENRYRVRYRKPDGTQTDKRGFRRKIDAETWAAEHVTIAKATGRVVPEFLRTLVFARPRGDDQFADCTFSPSLDMSR